MRHAVIPIFIPHKGCPFDCIYCNQKTISGETHEMTESRMKDIIEMHLASIDADCHVEIGFYGGSFTGIDRCHQISFLKVANGYFSDRRVKGIRLSTRPDYINDEILKYLKEYSVKTIELGAQSLDSLVLLNSCRGHTMDDVEKAAELIRKYGIELGIQTMIGLPKDTRQKDIETAHSVVMLKPEIVRIYPTLVIKGTYLEKMYNDHNYQPLTLTEAVEICAELLEIYERNHIDVIRVGLQPTDTINENMDVVAGPFHPAFRQLVEARRMRSSAVNKIEQEGLQEKKELTIYTSSQNISNVVGQKRENVEFLKRKYNYIKVKVLIDDTLSGKEMRLDYK